MSLLVSRKKDTSARCTLKPATTTTTSVLLCTTTLAVVLQEVSSSSFNNNDNMVMGVVVENAELGPAGSNNNVYAMMNETTMEKNMVSSKIDATSTTATPNTCGVWIAPSTIPGAGIGLFAGRDYTPGEQLLTTGDVAVPVIDLVASQADDSQFDFLWDEYTWSADSVKVFNEGIHEINVASNGFGAVANCMLPLVNVDEWYLKNDYAEPEIHRSKDPGAGAYTPYHDRTATAKNKGLKAGEELFVSYGENWFTTRPQLGPIPLFDDVGRATALYRKYDYMSKHTNLEQSALDELWDTFVKNTAFKDSRTIGAFHHDNPNEMQALKHKSLHTIRRDQSIRSIEWLEEHGRCADYMKAGPSSIPQAGRGAFATQTMNKGDVLAPLPLIHLLDRERLTMYNFTMNNRGGFRHQPRKGVQGYQLLMNYCMGHSESTLLLCPYGPMTMLVNHNKTLANVELRWADPTRSNHMPELLDSPLSRLETDATAKLAMEFVAIKDIKEGDEILMDYGEEWENAWLRHVKFWEPVKNAANYVPAWVINNDRSLRLPTEFEKLDGNWPDNLEIKCDGALMAGGEWREQYMAGTLEQYLLDQDNWYWTCEILRYRTNYEGEILYTVLMIRSDENGFHGDEEEDNEEPEEEEVVGAREYRVEDVPRECFMVMDKPYTSDIHLKNAFRHDIRIPDELFPENWKNAGGGYNYINGRHKRKKAKKQVEEEQQQQ